VLKEQSNNYCLPHDVLPCDDVLIRFELSCINKFLFDSRFSNTLARV